MQLTLGCAHWRSGGVRHARDTASTRRTYVNKHVMRRNLKYKIPQFRLALVKDKVPEPVCIFSPSDIEKFTEPLKHFSEEYFVAFHLDCKHHVIGYHEVSHGTLTSSLVHPREVFKSAILSNAYCLIVAHNHPGGSLSPSDDDIQTTKMLIEAGKIIGVHVLDHVIVSYRGIQSIRELHPELFSE